MGVDGERAVLADLPRDRAEDLAPASRAAGARVREFAIDEGQESHISDAEDARGGLLFLATGRDQLRRIDLGIIGSLRAVRNDKVAHLPPGLREQVRGARSADVGVTRARRDDHPTTPLAAIGVRLPGPLIAKQTFESRPHASILPGPLLPPP